MAQMCPFDVRLRALCSSYANLASTKSQWMSLTLWDTCRKTMRKILHRTKTRTSRRLRLRLYHDLYCVFVRSDSCTWLVYFCCLPSGLVTPFGIIAIPVSIVYAFNRSVLLFVLIKKPGKNLKGKKNKP